MHLHMGLFKNAAIHMQVCSLKKKSKNLTKALFNFRSPLISIIGGSKISTKLGVIQKLCDISDFIITEVVSQIIHFYQSDLDW